MSGFGMVICCPSYFSKAIQIISLFYDMFHIFITWPCQYFAIICGTFSENYIPNMTENLYKCKIKNVYVYIKKLVLK